MRKAGPVSVLYKSRCFDGQPERHKEFAMQRLIIFAMASLAIGLAMGNVRAEPDPAREEQQRVALQGSLFVQRLLFEPNMTATIGAKPRFVPEWRCSDSIFDRNTERSCSRGRQN
jgi:hypothetical protein